MTELRIWAGSETAVHSTMPQTCATDTAEAHALTARQTACTRVLKMFILKCAVLCRNNSCFPKRIVMNEHAGLHMHAA